MTQFFWWDSGLGQGALSSPMKVEAERALVDANLTLVERFEQKIQDKLSEI